MQGTVISHSEKDPRAGAPLQGFPVDQRILISSLTSLMMIWAMATIGALIGTRRTLVPLARSSPCTQCQTKSETKTFSRWCMRPTAPLLMTACRNYPTWWVQETSIRECRWLWCLQMDNLWESNLCLRTNNPSSNTCKPYKCNNVVWRWALGSDKKWLLCKIKTNLLHMDLE